MKYEWIKGKPPEYETLLYKSHYGTPKWEENFPKMRSDEVLATIQYNETGERKTIIAYTSDGVWHTGSFIGDKFIVEGKASIISWVPFPDPDNVTEREEMLRNTKPNKE